CQRRQRATTHRVHIAECVCGGDLAVDVRIVDDGREEIDRLHQRWSALPPVHTRIVRGPEIDKDPVVGGHRYGAQHLSELARGEFARSTGAGDHLRETLGHGSLRSGLMPPSAQSPATQISLSVWGGTACSRSALLCELLENPDQLVLRCEVDLEPSSGALTDDADASPERETQAVF